MEKLTITRALKELKLLESRINKKINDFNPVALTQKKQGDLVIGLYKTIKDFEKDTKSEYESINALINRRRLLKQKIATSNATTVVKVVGEKMTIIEALEAKTVAGHKKLLMNKLKNSLVARNAEIDKHNKSLEEDLHKMVVANTGKDRKIDSEDYKRIADPFWEANKLSKIDPVDSEVELKKIEDYLEKFEQDIDIVLSESNSRTEIEI